MKAVMDGWHEKVIVTTVDFRSQAAHAVREVKEALAKTEQSTQAVIPVDPQQELRHLQERLNHISAQLDTYQDTRVMPKQEECPP
jgi:predicted exporter